MPKFLLAGDNSILRGKIERNRRFTIYLSKKNQIKLAFNMTWRLWRFRDLHKKTDSDKVLLDKAFTTAKNSKYEEYQRGVALMLYNLFNKNF